MADPAPSPSPNPPPAATAKGAPPPRRGALRRLGASFGVYLAGVVAVALLAAAALGWVLLTESGAQWLLARVPGLQASGVSGSVLGRFSAQQLDLQLPDGGMRVAVHQLSWSAPRLRWGSGSVWLNLEFDELQAQRIELWPSSQPDGEPVTAPTRLDFPLGLQVEALRIGELRIEGLDPPLRELGARVALGTDGGALHRIDALSLAWDRLRLSGQAQLATRGDLALDAALQITQQAAPQATAPSAPAAAVGAATAADTAADTAEWSAALQLNGPLTSPHLRATLRARGVASQPAQTLDASAELRPFAAWPLGELQASARALDLSALHSAAPRTALDLQASASSSARELPAAVALTLRNHDAGRWSDGQLPLRTMELQLQARPDDPSQIDIQAFEAELGSARSAAGQLSGSGQWHPAAWQLDTRLRALQPAALDARAPQMMLGGQLQLEGSGFDGTAPHSATVRVRGQIDGRQLGIRSAQPVQLRLDAQLNPLHIELHQLLAQAGSARASASGRLTRPDENAAWAARAQVNLSDFDPVPWWPGPEDSAWRRAAHRINASADVDLRLPQSANSALQWLQRLRGQAQLKLLPSQLAGVPLSGQLALRAAAAGPATGQLRLLADGNQIDAQGQWDSAGAGRADRLELKADLPALARLQPLWKLALPAGEDARLDGALQADFSIDGRWPQLRAQGRLDTGKALQLGALRIQRADARWNLGSAPDALLDAQVDIQGLAHGERSADAVQLKLQGTPQAHTLQLQGDSKSLPPAWVEALQNAPAGTRSKRTHAELRLSGGLQGSPGAPSGWSGKLQQLLLRGDAAAAAPWLQLKQTELRLRWADGPMHVAAEAGSAELLGATLGWNRIAWTAADPGRAPAKIDVDAQLEPLDVAPLLKRAQPHFGWGGDLRLRGHVQLRSAPSFSADVVLERASGDLSVTDDAGTRTLGLSDLRLGLVAQDGSWRFSAGLAGQTLGRAAAGLTAQASPHSVWPGADAPLSGVLELQIDDLGVWGPWLPPGWRLNGAMHASASLGGRAGAPLIEGRLDGSSISVRNLLQGVDVRDGTVAIALLGETAHIETFTARAGDGSLKLQGDAHLGAAPRAELKLTLEQFRLLGRVDRRIVTSGDATLRLGADTLALSGALRVDEGLIDFSRSEAPSLSDDVNVYRGESADFKFASANGAQTDAEKARARRVSLDLRVDLGDKLRIRGQGLDAGLRGELRLSAPQGRLRVDGSVRTVDGSYRAYRQRLDIERGVLTFNGPIDNPQLDIQAVRPNLDVRVGVAVTGTVLVPRIRLFSEPEMADAEKLSWLLRGRASDGPGTGDTALLQAAAMALISGDEPSALDQFFNLFGLDDLSVRQSDDVGGGAIVSVGKQLSRNWYVGYERGLNATTGNWQLIYRIAQRFTIRAQSGEQNSIELIWSWRWN
jgi:translocation and assembly module TamB